MIHSIIDFLHKITNPEELSVLIDTALSGWWVYVVMVAIIFSENAFLLGFILPGDSLLFTLGVVAGTGKIHLWVLLCLLMPAAILGDSTGYYLGKKTGPRIFSRPDSRLFKQEYVKRTQEFFEKYGGKAVLIARFLPVVRSFTPFMAGVGHMPYHTFIFYNVLGSTLWVCLFTISGYFLGNVPIVANNFEKVVLMIVFVSFIPAVIEYIRHRRRLRREASSK
jgi:membrane-associated protein